MSATKEENTNFAIHPKGYKILIIGIVVIIIGFILMSGGGSHDPKVFSEEIFSFRRLTLAPIVVIVGFIITGFSLLYNPKKNQ